MSERQRQQDEPEHAVADEANRVWIVREIERLAKNQHNLANSINSFQLTTVDALGQQTRELGDRIIAAQREISMEFKKIVEHAEATFGARIDRVEVDLKENKNEVVALKLEMTTVKVRVGIWCAIGAAIASIVSTVITASIIKMAFR